MNEKYSDLLDDFLSDWKKICEERGFSPLDATEIVTLRLFVHWLIMRQALMKVTTYHEEMNNATSD